MNCEQPNVLIFICDHLSFKALGREYASTPAMDAIVDGGVSFENSYCTFPLCVPSRTSFWTGRYPHETGIEFNWNDKSYEIPPGMETLGGIFTGAGYEAIHAGKRHDAGSLRFFDCFNSRKSGEAGMDNGTPWKDYYGTITDVKTTEACTAFLKRRHSRPFLCVADYFNPHDILPWMNDNTGPHQDRAVGGILPPLPDNFEIEDFKNRPLPVQNLCCRHRRLAQASNWSGENYRHYLAAYYHYINRVDREIGKVLSALRAAPEGENTLVVLMADHGNGMAAHRMVSAHGTFYEEIMRVPLVFSGPPVGKEAGARRFQLVSLLDLLPTLCDFAGLDPPAGLHGRSLRGLIEGSGGGGREYAAGEWKQGSRNGCVSPGRMIRTKDFKYVRYLEGGGEELYDLKNDPGEKMNLAGEEGFSAILCGHRGLLEKHLEKTADGFLSLAAETGGNWKRTHKPGYWNHPVTAIPHFA